VGDVAEAADQCPAQADEELAPQATLLNSSSAMTDYGGRTTEHPMARVLIGVLGYGERPPNVRNLLALCEHEATTAVLVTWHCPGTENARVLQALADLSPKLQVQSTTANPGSAGGYARLLERASACGEEWDYLLLLDDDLDIEPAAMDRLVVVAEADPVRDKTLFMAYRHGLTELEALVEHGRPLRDIRPGACVGFHFLNVTGAGERHSSRSDNGQLLLDGAPYGGLLIPLACLARLGMPEPALFLYADDAEWTLRFTRDGGLIRLVSEAPVSDRSPSWNATRSIGGNIARRVLHLGATKAYYEARNRNFLARKYYPGRRFTYLANRTLFLAALYLLAAANFKVGRARLIHRAIGDGEIMARCSPASWPLVPPGLD
jgi:GT2 family glycosyltransferase